MSDVSFPELVSQYCAYKFLRPKTEEDYAGAVRVFKHYADEYMGGDIFPSEVSMNPLVLSWRRAIVRSPNNPSGIAITSWNSYVRHLSALYNFGIRNELIGGCTQNPFHGVRIREPKKPKKTLQLDVITMARKELNNCRLYELATGQPASLHPAWFWETVLETFYYTGIRLRQLLYVQPQHVDLKHKILLGSSDGSKSHSEFQLPIPDKLLPHISQLMAAAYRVGIGADDQLFNVNRFSHRHRLQWMNKNQISSFFERLSNHCGARITPHRFRHTLGTDLMEEPERNLQLTQQILSHSDIRSTLEYVHPKTETLRMLLNQR